MNTMIRFGIVAALVAAAGMVRGADEKPFDAAARAKRDRAVSRRADRRHPARRLHADRRRRDPGEARPAGARRCSRNCPRPRRRGAEMLAAFTQAGGKDVYVGVTLAGPLPRRGHVLLRGAPFAGRQPGRHRRHDPRNTLASRSARVERIGDVLLVTRSREMIDRLKSLPPVAERKISPDVEKAFAAAGDTAAQLLVLPPEYSRRVIAEMMPTLPEEVGGGPSSVLTDGLRWAAIGVDFPPKLALRVTIQSKDAAAAEALEKELGVLWQKLAENEEVRRDVPDLRRDRQGADPHGRRRPARPRARRGQPGRGGPGRCSSPARRGRSAAHRSRDVHEQPQADAAWRCTTTTTPTSRSPADVRDAQGKPLLSWRVLILPYLEEKGSLRAIPSRRAVGQPEQ